MKRVSSATGGNPFDPGSSRPAGTPADRAGGSRTSNNPFLRSRRESTAGAQSSSVPTYQNAATQTQAAPSVASPTSAASPAQSVDGRSDASSVAEGVAVLNRLRQSFPALLMHASETSPRHIHPVDDVRMFMEHALDEASGQIDRLLERQGLRADLRAPMLAGLRQEFHHAFEQAARTFNDSWFAEVETHSGAHTDTETEPLLGHREASRAASTRASSPQGNASANQAAPAAQAPITAGRSGPGDAPDPVTQRLLDMGMSEQRVRELTSGMREISALQRRETAPAAMQTSAAAVPDAPTLSRAQTLDPGSLEDRLAGRGMSLQQARETAETFRAMVALARSSEQDR